MEDRFSLLYLEPGEIYFCDVAVTFCQDPDVKENHRTSLTLHQKSGASTKKEEDNRSKDIYSAKGKMKMSQPAVEEPFLVTVLDGTIHD